MVRVDLKGVAKVRAKGKIYYYAWRGGPRLRGQPGSPEFIASYHEARDGRRGPDDGTLRSLVALYRAGPYIELAESTRRNWSTWLDRIGEHFGPLRLAQFDRPDKIRPVIRRWRSRYADRPRTADYAMQVLSRVLSHGVELGRLGANPCEGIKQLYSVSRAEVIWSPDDIARLKRMCSIEIAYAVDLSAHTGLRLGDLVRLSWTHIGEDAIVVRTRKSRLRREAIIPLYDALRDVIGAIPKRATTVLTSSRRRPWTENGLGSSFNKAKIDAGLAEVDLHFNDLRGTAATRFYLAGIPVRAIAEIMGWEEQSVDKIIRRYVDRTAATRALIDQLNQAERRT